MPPLIRYAAAWFVGLVAAREWLVPFGVRPEPVMLCALLPAATLCLWPKDRSLRTSCLFALVLLVAALRYQAALPDFHDPGFVGHYNGKGPVILRGVVRAYPDVRDTWTYLRVTADEIELGGVHRPVRGSVIIRVPRWPEYRYGDRVLLSGELLLPPEFEDFSYRDYLAHRGIFSLMSYPHLETLGTGAGCWLGSVVFAVKDRARQSIARMIAEPESSLLQGILLGIRSGIPSDLWDALNATGTSHIVVISGANMVLVAALFARSAERLVGKRKAYWATLLGIGLYVLMVGAEMPVLRAAVVSLLYLTARYLGRQSTSTVSLAFAAVLVTAITPSALWDISFQLSFAAALGIVLLAPPMESCLQRILSTRVGRDRLRAVMPFLGDLVIVTLAAQAATLPLILFAFGRLSLVAPVANALIAPVQPLIMGWGGAATCLDMIPGLGFAARPVAWVAWLLLAYSRAVVDWTASWPAASLQVSRAAGGWLALLLLGLAAAWHAVAHRMEPIRRAWQWATQRRLGIAIFGIALLVAILVWVAILQLPDGRLHVAFLDVGEGDAILITTAEGRQILVDGGPSPAALMSALGKKMPFWDRSLDLVVSTHTDADHMTGLVEVLERFEVGAWFESGQPEGGILSQRCSVLLERARIPRHRVAAGETLDLGGDSQLQILHPPQPPAAGVLNDDNQRSVVLCLVQGEFAVLLTADIDAIAERFLLEAPQPLRADVLKVAHHGSAGSSSAAFLEAVDPSLSVISVGSDNRSGHPSPALLERLAQLEGCMVLRTDQHGTVEVTTDGWQLWVSTER